MIGRGRALAGSGLLVIGLASAAIAHDVPVEQVVRVVVRPDGSRLGVRIHIPASLLADANLPTTETGYLKLAEIDPALRLVAADAASHLEMEQDDWPLAPPLIRAAVLVHGGEPVFWSRASADVELEYTMAPGGRGLSARLNTFRRTDQPVRTIVVYESASGARREFSLAGHPQRVRFDPDRAQAMQDFASRALASLLDRSDWLLFLLVLLVPRRPFHKVGPAALAFAFTQAIAVLAGAAWTWPRPEAPLALDLAAASFIVVAALQNFTGAAERWLVPVAGGFGALAGFAFGRGFHDAAVFAGSHGAIAIATYLAAIVAIQAWAGAVFWSAIGVLYRGGVSDRFATILLSVVVAHTALHRMMDRGEALAQLGSVTSAHAIAALALAWAALVLGAGVLDASVGGRRHTASPASLPSA